MPNDNDLNGAANQSPFKSPEWRLTVEADGSVDGGQSYHADVYRGEVFMCRIALAGSFANQAAAEEGLDRRLKAWLEDYENRLPLDGDAELSP